MKKKPYDPNDFSTYVGEPTRCDGCGYKGDPAQEGMGWEPLPGEKRDPDLSYWFCDNCKDD